MTDTDLFKEIYLGVAYDTMRVLGYRYEQFYIDIKPKVYNDQIVIGQAFTTYGEVVSNKDNYKELDNIRLDMYGELDNIHNKYKVNNLSPFILLQSNDYKVAHSGDITSLIYQKLKSVGFITDGIVRDIDKIKEIKFPTFCRDTNPIDAIDYWALTKYNCNLQINSVNINPGDIIMGSREGVIRIKLKDWELFKKECKKILDKENKARHLVKICDMDSNNVGDYFNNVVKQIGRW